MIKLACDHKTLTLNPGHDGEFMEKWNTIKSIVRSTPNPEIPFNFMIAASKYRQIVLHSDQNHID